jgi:hypothetical protein
MMTLMIAAAVAAQPAPPANPHGQMAPMQGQQHEGMKNDCCCKEMMEKMHEGQDMDRMHDHQEHQEHKGR